MVSHWIAGRDEKALAALDALSAMGIRTSGMAGLKAALLVRKGDVAEARSFLDDAWQQAKTGPAEIGAEATIMDAQGDKDGALRAWRSYVRALDLEGPALWTRAQAQARIDALDVQAASATAESESSGSDVPWMWILVIAAAIAGALALRGRQSPAGAEG